MKVKASLTIDELDFEKGGGLIPVVVQDMGSGEVVMVAYANREAVELTLKTGYAHYWSRSRQQLWRKGETSGNTQRVRQVLVDCDRDTLLYLVEQKGVACHTGEFSCFHRELKES
jgi:phosphoribosyl-AMP cyclohydrolase